MLNVKYPPYYSVDLNNYLRHPWLLKQKRINNNKEIIVFGKSFLKDGKVNKPASKFRMSSIEFFKVVIRFYTLLIKFISIK